MAKNRTLKRWVLSTLAGLAFGATAAGQGAPIHTKNTALRLPVSLDERSRPEVAEVRLYVRGPSGRWEMAQSAAATQTAFDFKAPVDGEYWFTFVTVDRRGIAAPVNVEKVAPHRIVVVDSTAPEVAIRPVPFNGERALQCQVRDANADLGTLRVSYLTADGAWQTLSAAGPDTPTVFRVSNVIVFVSKVKVTVADRAGNRTTKEFDLGDPSAPLGMPTKPALDRGKPDPSTFPREGVTPSKPETGSSYNALKPPATPDIKPANDLTIPDIKVPDVPGVKPTPKPMPSPSEFDLPPLPKPNDVKLPESAPMKGVDNSLKLPDVLTTKGTDLDIKAPEMPPPVKGADPKVKLPVIKNSDLEITLPDPISPKKIERGVKAPDLPPMKDLGIKVPDLPMTDPYVRPVEAAPKDVPASKPMADPPPTLGSHPILNTRTCVINYEAEGPMRAGAKIDFWATKDGGRTWDALRDEAGGIPPARLTLPGDGNYGIRIRPGAGSKPPEAGEDPDCVVEVDTTRPAVNLLRPVIGTGSDEGSLVISWTAADKNLLSNSVSLFYADRSEGPWKEIVKGYKNEGVYKWAMPANLSGDVYLRVEAVDRAGNVGRHDMNTPVALESGKGRVKVTGVGPSK